MPNSRTWADNPAGTPEAMAGVWSAVIQLPKWRGQGTPLRHAAAESKEPYRAACGCEQCEGDEAEVEVPKADEYSSGDVARVNAEDVLA
jgi:hypothetical protein